MDTKNKKILILLVIFLTFINNAFSQRKVDDLPKNITQSYGTDIIPDEKTAIKIAEIILLKRYVNIDSLNYFKPFKVKLICNDRVWELKLEEIEDKIYKKNYNIRLNKNTGEVLNIWSSH